MKLQKLLYLSLYFEIMKVMMLLKEWNILKIAFYCNL